MFTSRNYALALVLTSVWAFWPAFAAAQETGRVRGTVTKSTDGQPLGLVRVTVAGTGISTTTNPDGSYLMERVPVGTHIVLFRWLGYQPQEGSIAVQAGGDHVLDASLVARVVSLADMVVESASKRPERVVDAPAAIAVIDPVTIRNQSITGQAPTALKGVPGVEIVQSGMNDFNVNARGFNSSLNRRVLVLQDGRDLAVALLGNQEWNSLSIPLEDFSRMEMVRGPGSALYGANAFSGVINLTTPTARDIVGTKATLGGGELSTMRFDLRHAGTTANGRFGYRANLGYYASDSWTISRTAFDGRDSRAEYDEATDNTVTVPPPPTGCTGMGPDCIAVEAIPLAGQTRDGTTGVASGSADAIRNMYGSGRLDYYVDNGSVFSVEGGATQVENAVVVTGIGRVQVPKALKPWARIGFDADRFSLMGWYTGRDSRDPQRSLASGVALEEQSSIFHVEGQTNHPFANDRGRFVVGASFRNYNLDTQGTLINPSDDNRNDTYSSGYGQVEFDLTSQLKVVAAARVDNGTLFETQFSPKAAIVFSPNESHSIRASVNRAFQTPNYSEYFLAVAAGAPQSTATAVTLEQGLDAYFATITDASQVGAPLAGLVSSVGATNAPQAWNFQATTPVLARGNDDLDVEKVTGWELGYKGSVSTRAYLSVDLFYNRLSNFVTDLLFGVNPAFPQFGLGTDSLAALLATIDGALATQGGLPANHPLRQNNAALQAGLTQLSGTALNSPALSTVNGQRAIVASYANAGRVDEYGVEFGFGYGFTPELRVDATYTFFEFDVKSQQANDQLVPNTPKHKGTLGVTYTGQQGFEAGASVRLTDEYEWAAGVFVGTVPSSQMVDVNVGYHVNNNVRIFVSGTNIFDQKRFQLYGGSLIQRRVLGGVTTTF